MDSLTLKINQLRKKICTQEVEDKELKQKVNTAIKAVFCDIEIGCDNLMEFHLNKGNLYLNAKSKTTANELFLRKNQILKNLKDYKRIKKIIIK